MKSAARRTAAARESVSRDFKANPHAFRDLAKRRRAGFGVAAALWLSPAFAHAVCGDRIFPATLGIDDPGVGDELALPTLT